MKIYLAVGHGIQPSGVHDPGAVSGSTTEQTAGDVIVREAARLLREAGEDVSDEAFDDDPNFVGTAAAANKWGADLLVAVHHDWTGGIDAHGFWYPGSADGERLTRSILDEIDAAGFPMADGRERGRDLYVLRTTAMPASLIEVGKIGDPSIDTDAERVKMGRAIAEGVAHYAGVSIPDPTPEPAPASEWRFPAGAKILLDRGIFTASTKPGTEVGTDRLAAFLARTVSHLEARDDRLSGRVAALEAAIAQVDGTADVDLDAVVSAAADAAVAEILRRLSG